MQPVMMRLTNASDDDAYEESNGILLYPRVAADQKKRFITTLLQSCHAENSTSSLRLPLYGIVHC
jgi:hypothetical protein